MPYTLVTGSNGYIASHIVKELLDQGLNVIGTVRSFNKAAKLIKKFPKEFKSGKLRFTEVDFTDKPSIESVFHKHHDIKAIIHPAQDFAREETTPEGLDEHLIKYTEQSLNDLIEIAESSDSPIERFVYFSTSIAIRGRIYDHTVTFTEEDFASLTLEEALRNNLDAYTYAKVRGEKTVLAHESAKGIEYKIIVPPTVIGPPLSLWDDDKHFEANNQQLFDVFKGRTPTRGVEWYADVRNIASAAVQAADKTKTPGTKHNRYVIIDGAEDFLDAVSVLKKNFSDKNPGNWDELEVKGKAVNKDRKIAQRDFSATESEIKHEWISFEKTITDTVNLFLELEKELAT